MSEVEASSTSAHIAGNFYSGTSQEGTMYIGPKDKAEAYARGEFTPTYRHTPAAEVEAESETEEVEE